MEAPGLEPTVTTHSATISAFAPGQQPECALELPIVVGGCGAGLGGGAAGWRGGWVVGWVVRGVDVATWVGGG